MQLSFMTWICPEWDLTEVLTAALRYGYGSIEPRAEADHAHGIEIDTTKKQRASIRAAFDDMGIGMSCIATSRRYALDDEKERAESVDLTKRYIELADDLGCNHIRVFGGQTPEDMSFDDAKSCVAESLHEAAEAAEGSDVYVCIETHDAYCLADDLMEVVTMADHEHVKVCWDIMHPVTHGMSMQQAFEHVKDEVLHCHIHDGIRSDDPDETSWEMCATGQGDIPHEEAVELLASIDFQGALSGEWFTDLDPDEILPQNARVLTEYMHRTKTG